MKTRCPQCHALYEIEDSFVGQKVECPACQNKWIVGEGEKEEKYFRLEATPHLINESLVLGISVFLFLFGSIFSGIPLLRMRLDVFFYASPIVLSFWIPALAFCLYAILNNRHTKYILEPDKITIRVGIITKNTSTIRISDIKDVIQEQGRLQRLFNIATLCFSTEETLCADFYLLDVKDYQLWKAKIEKLVEQRRGRA